MRNSDRRYEAPEGGAINGRTVHHRREATMSGQGSTGNVIAALASFFVPGLGQLIQGRLLMAIVQFVLAGVLWFFLLGWLVHLWSVLDAALWKPKS
jgi:TM2 domain-containing membrane protein YozV